MTEVDLLSDILSSNPNDPAPKGAVLLLRTEMNAGFKDVKQKLDQVERKFDEQLGLINRSLDLIARQVAILVGRDG